MNDQLFNSLVFKAGFTGSDLSNTQFGTSYEHALKNLVELVVEECTNVVKDITDLNECNVYQYSVEESIKLHFGISE